MSTRKPTKKATGGKAPAKKSTKKAPVAPAATPQVAGTLRLPKVGEKITRSYRGKDHIVEIIDGGFRHAGHDYTSLTALAKEITGYRAISGPAFFGLWKREGAK